MRPARFLKKLLKWSVLGLLGIIALYLLAAGALTLIPANAGKIQPASGVEVFIISNGVHADICLPVQAGALIWEDFLDLRDFGAMDIRYLAFGRGDRAFYLQTPTWNELEAGTAFRALFWQTSPALHVTAYLQKPRTGAQVRSVILSNVQYKQVVDFVRSAFRTDEWGQPVRIEGAGYTRNRDNFYEGTGSYHLFNNSNTWTNESLRQAGVKTAWWAPFDRCVLYHFPRE